jgi:hypothetical protein
MDMLALEHFFLCVCASPLRMVLHVKKYIISLGAVYLNDLFCFHCCTRRCKSFVSSLNRRTGLRLRAGQLRWDTCIIGLEYVVS